MKFLNALGFLTVIKIPQRFYLKKEQFPDTLIYFPAVGLIIGLAISIFFTALRFIFPLFLTAVFAVGLEIILTGGLHIDGVADMFDGTFSGESDKNKILEIMKKGDVGVFGIIIIVFTIILKIGFIYFIASMLPGMSGLPAILAIIFFTPAFGRWSMLYLFSKYEPVKREGSLTNIFTGRNSKKIFGMSSLYFLASFILVNSLFPILNFFVSNNRLLFAGFLSGVVAGVIHQNSWLLVLFFILKNLLIILLLYAFLVAAGKFFTRRIGGISGDIIGGVCVLTEIMFLILNYLSIKFL
jgi:adenosylcobinamide-GDP ribazoletransferase